MDDPRDKLIRQLHETIRQQQGVIARQSAHIEQLQAKVVVLEGRIEQPESGKGNPKGMPVNKLEAAEPSKGKALRRKGGRAFVPLTGLPTHRVVHAVEGCGGCGTRLTHGSVKRTREVIEVPVERATVTEHVFVERRCPVATRSRVRRCARAAWGWDYTA